MRGIYLESWFSWLWGGVQKTSKKRRKQTKKTWKSEEKEKRRIRGKSNNNRKHVKNIKKICCWKTQFEYISLVYIVYIINSFLQFLCVARYLKHGNDITKINIHKYTNYNLIEICTNTRFS